MPKTNRVVVDTNVIVSASLAKRSLSRKAFNRIVNEYTLLLSEDVFAEIEEVLNRPKLDKYSLLEERISFFREIVKEAIVINTNSSITDCADPKDNKFLELAVDGKATHIITGDEHLLAMNPYRGIAILSPSNFLKENLPKIN
jgi:putative PIN family toxin of toxin-antitoxin system